MRIQILYLARDFVFAPQTFRRPKDLTVAAPPSLGEKCPELPGLVPGHPTVVGFLRHVGCPFAEATVREMERLAAVYPDVTFVAVTHSAEEPSLRWCETFAGAKAVMVVTDPERAYYAAWGVGLTDKRHFAGRESLSAVFRLLDQGIHNRWASGTRWQGAATFGMDAGGVLRFRHFPRHAGDLPALDDACRAIIGTPEEQRRS